MTPKILTRQMRANDVVKRWAKQYPAGTPHSEMRNVTLPALVALGATPDPDEVDKVIGVMGWTHGTCANCGERSGRTVLMGGDDYHGPDEFCEPCVSAASAALSEPRP